MSESKLPVYKITISPEYSEDGEKLGIQQIAYTDIPAILTKGVAFNQAKKLVFADGVKMRVAAPAIIPMQIYRFDDDLGEYYVEFTVEEIERLVQDFMLNKQADVFNVDHNSEFTAPSYILESWIIEDPATDKSLTTYGIEGLPKGSFFVVSQITDKKFFEEEIIAKDRTGYSIEGFLGMSLNRIKEKIKASANAAPSTEEVENNTKEEIQITMNEETKLAEIARLKAELAALETPEEVTEVAAAEEPVAEEVPTEEAPADEASSVDEAAILKVVQPLIDEVYKALAEIKSMVEGEPAAEEPAEDPSKLSKGEVMNAKLSALRKLIN